MRKTIIVLNQKIVVRGQNNAQQKYEAYTLFNRKKISVIRPTKAEAIFALKYEMEPIVTEWIQVQREKMKMTRKQ